MVRIADLSPNCCRLLLTTRSLGGGRGVVLCRQSILSTQLPPTMEFKSLRETDLETYAAECLLAMSHNKVPDENANYTHHRNYTTLETVLCDEAQPIMDTVMVARILTDLKQIRQDSMKSVPAYFGACEKGPLPADFHNYHTVNKTKRGKGAATTTPSFNDRRGTGNIPVADPKKLHRCHYKDCGKVYGKSSHLKAHLRTHTGKSEKLNGLMCMSCLWRLV